MLTRSAGSYVRMARARSQNAAPKLRSPRSEYHEVPQFMKPDFKKISIMIWRYIFYLWHSGSCAFPQSCPKMKAQGHIWFLSVAQLRCIGELEFLGHWLGGGDARWEAWWWCYFDTDFRGPVKFRSYTNSLVIQFSISILPHHFPSVCMRFQGQGEESQRHRDPAKKKIIMTNNYN